MIYIISTNYEILMGFFEKNFNPEIDYLIFTDKINLEFYLKKMKIMGLYNIKINLIEMIKNIKSCRLSDIVYILDIDYDRYIYWIRHFSNYLDYIAVYKYVALDEDDNIKNDRYIDDRTKILELITHKFLKKLLFHFEKSSNNINYYKKCSIETPFF